MLDENPYASPRAIGNEFDFPVIDRVRTQFRWRLALSMFVVPAAIDYSCHMAMDPTAKYYLIIPDAIICLFLFGSAWKWSLSLLEWFAGLLRRFSSPTTHQNAWNQALYRSLEPAPFVALGGAALWLIWIAGFWFLQMRFDFITSVLGLPAVLLAGVICVPLVRSWIIAART